jgi:hypothetical protein
MTTTFSSVTSPYHTPPTFRYSLKILQAVPLNFNRVGNLPYRIAKFQQKCLPFFAFPQGFYRLPALRYILKNNRYWWLSPSPTFVT